MKRPLLRGGHSIGCLAGIVPNGHGTSRRSIEFGQCTTALEWFYDGTAPIARLLRPQRRAYDGSFGIELVLPHPRAMTSQLQRREALRPRRPRIARSLRAHRGPISQRSIQTIRCNGSMVPLVILDENTLKNLLRER